MASPADRAAWQADFERLLDHMASAYANLEWAREERGLDVYALAERARAELAETGSRRAARRAVRRFVEAFGDPHFRVLDGIASQAAQLEPEPIPRTAQADDALDVMGFKSRDLSFRLDFERLEGFQPLHASAANPFAFGLLTLPNGARVGMVRIAHFGENGYPQVARGMWAEFAAALSGDCGLECQWEFRHGVMNRLLAYLAEGTRFLTEQGIDALLVDIVKNGGGTDWAAIAPRLFAPPLINCPDGGVIRHPHHSERFARRLASVDELLSQPDLTAQSRRLIERARENLATSFAAADSVCDRRAMFDRPDFEPSCSQLHVTAGCGAFEYLPPGSLAGVSARGSLFAPLDFEFEEALWTGPLFVVMDGSTASASEHFLALLEANSAATFLGQRSQGAGCGYIGGGVPALLGSLDLTVRMSDCVRFRADGRNELEGIDPHVPIEWSGSDGAKAERVQRELATRVASPRTRDATSDRAAILAASAEFSRAWVAGDTTALGELYADTARILPVGREMRGKAAIRRYFAPRPERRQVAHAMTSELLRLDGDSAWDRGRWFSVTGSLSARPDSAAGGYGILWRRQADGVWRIEVDAWH